MSIAKSICMAVQLSLVGSLFAAGVAETFTWSSAVSGNWNDPTKWTGGTDDEYPHGEDTVTWKVPGAGGYTVSLTQDESCKMFSTMSSFGNGMTLDLGGHTLTFTHNTYAITLYGGSQGADNMNYCGDTLIIRNGSLLMPYSLIKLVNLLGGVNASSCTLALEDHATVESSLYFMANSSRIFVRDGSVLRTRISLQMANHTANGRYPRIIVSGKGSLFEFASGQNLTVRGRGNSLLEVSDGASLTVNSLLIGNTAAVNAGSLESTDTLARFENGSATLAGDIEIGWTADVDLAPRLLIAGTNTVVTAAGALQLHEGIGAVLEFAPGAGGFLQSPLNVASLAFIEKPEGNVDRGPVRLRIRGLGMAEVGGGSTTLLTLSAPDAEGLAKLVANVDWADWPAAQAEAGNVPEVAVSDDGTSLVLTVPSVDFTPDLAVTTAAGDAAGRKKISVKVTDYGLLASKITVVECTFADNEDFTGSVTTNFLQGGATISGTLPKTESYQLVGDFAPDVRYWAKVKIVNERGHEKLATVWLDGDGTAETFTWAASEDGYWNDPTKWTGGSGDEQVRFPHAEDTITWKYPGAGGYTVTLARDESCKMFSEMSSFGNGLTLDLGGHTLTLTHNSYAVELTWGSVGKDDLNRCGSVFVIRNGSFLMPTSLIRVASPIGGANTGSSTIVLEDHAVLDTALYFMANSSRLFISGGSVLRTRQNLTMSDHTANGKYPRILVSGEGSALEVTSGKDLTVRGGINSLLSVSDGARLTANSLWIGHSNATQAGSVESTNTLARFENGRATLAADIEIGWAADMNLVPRLLLAGSNTTVTAAGSLQLHEGIGASLEFAPGKDGFRQCPLSVGSVAFIAKPDGNADRGAVQLKLTVRDWMRANPEASMDLITLAAPDAAALATLKARAVFTDCSTSKYQDQLAVSEDGCKLTLTAPAKLGMMFIVR